MRYIRFILVGAICLLIDATIYFLLSRIFLLDQMYSRSLSISCAFFINFFMNRSITFNTFSSFDNFKKQILRFSSVVLMTSLMNLLIFAILINLFNVNDLIALFFNSFIFSIINFRLHKSWTFR